MTDTDQRMRGLDPPHVLYVQDRTILRRQLLHNCHGALDMGRIVLWYPHQLSSNNAEILPTHG